MWVACIRWKIHSFLESLKTKVKKRRRKRNACLSVLHSEPFLTIPGFESHHRNSRSSHRHERSWSPCTRMQTANGHEECPYGACFGLAKRQSKRYSIFTFAWEGSMSLATILWRRSLRRIWNKCYMVNYQKEKAYWGCHVIPIPSNICPIMSFKSVISVSNSVQKSQLERNGKPDFTCQIQNFQKRFRTFRGLERLTNFVHNPQTQINIT